jgi:hypothetical protein
MNSTLLKKIELLANISIIVVAVIFGFVLIKRFVLPTQSPAPNDGIKVGSKVSLTDVDWSHSDRNLVLILQKGCHFCSESAPFYQRLARQMSERGDVRLIAALPQNVEEGGHYLSELGVPISEVRQTTLASLGAQGTPTLLLVDHTGAVSDVWVGKLPPDKEAEVLRRLEAR